MMQFQLCLIFPPIICQVGKIKKKRTKNVRKIKDKTNEDKTKRTKQIFAKGEQHLVFLF